MRKTTRVLGGLSILNLMERFTKGETRGGLRANVREAAAFHFEDGPVQPRPVQLHYVRDELTPVVTSQPPATMDGMDSLGRFDLTWDEFYGTDSTVDTAPNVNNPGIISFTIEEHRSDQWPKWRKPKMLYPAAYRNFYQLLVTPESTSTSGKILLTFEEQVVGGYEYEVDVSGSEIKDYLGIEGHTGNCFGRELVLCAYRLVPWRNVRRRGGVKSFV
jgi:hypothetical protein